MDYTIYHETLFSFGLIGFLEWLWSFEKFPVRIGLVLSIDSIIGKVTKVAINVVVADVNANSDVLGGTKLKLSLHDTNFSGFLETMKGKFFMTSTANDLCNLNLIILLSLVLF